MFWLLKREGCLWPSSISRHGIVNVGSSNGTENAILTIVEREQENAQTRTHWSGELLMGYFSAA